VADDEDNVGDLHAGEITQREIEDGQLIRNSEKRLREVVGMRPQSATRSGGEHKALHDGVSSALSRLPGTM
jgi:hypothetical protein